MALAIFDLDETLISGDCASLWSAWMAHIGWVDDEEFTRRDRELMALYSQGKLAMEDYMTFSLQPLIGRSPQDVHAAVGPYIDSVVKPRMYPSAFATVNSHRDAKDRLLVISASPIFLVKPIAACFGIEECLAIDVEVAERHYTGRTSGVLTYRDGKVIRLEKWLDENDESLVGASFYSDSRNDIPLLSKVDNPIAVNPDEFLLKHASESGWRILDWSVS